MDGGDGDRALANGGGDPFDGAVSFENMHGRVGLADVPERAMPPAVEVWPSGDDEFEAWVDVMADGFAPPDTRVPSHGEFPREVIPRAERDVAAAGVKRYLAPRDGGLRRRRQPPHGSGNRAAAARPCLKGRPDRPGGKRGLTAARVREAV
jgi:hypothetical protein